MDSLEELKLILGSFLEPEEMPPYLDQLDTPFSELEDKWVKYVPEVIQRRWDSLDPDIKCALIVMGIRNADLDSILDDYQDSFQ